MGDPALAAEYFDGRSARAVPVRLGCEAGSLAIRGAGVEHRVPLAAVVWPERTRHGPRVAELPGGASLHCTDAAAWDAFARACGRRDSLVVRLQQRWRWALASLAAAVGLFAALYAWGVPWAAQAALAFVPPRVDKVVGERVLESLDEHLLRPSTQAPERRLALSASFAQALRSQPPGSVPDYRLVFRRSRIGPNALALPDGTIVLTDELVELVDADPAVVTGVLAHELGHLRRRHGMRLLLQAGAVAVLAGAVMGDFSTLLAGAPVLLGQAAYARDAEREADAESVRVLRDAGLSPAVMVGFFEKMATRHGGPAIGIAFASHPADAERIAFFRDAARQR